MLRTVAGGVIAAVIVAAAAQGGQTNRAEFELGLTAKAPGVPTGATLHALFKDPDDPEAKPPLITGGSIVLPAGTRVDDAAVPQCAATDDEFQADGRDACPKDTQVGSGTLTVMLGAPGDPQELDIVAFNGDGELTEVVFFKDTNVVAAIDRVEVSGGALHPHPPARPGGPPDGTANPRELRLEIPRRVGKDGRSYLTAPPTCTSGQWRSTATFEFADGGKTTVPYRAPCAQPALRVAVRPGAARVGERTVFRIRVSSNEPSCVDGARVKLGADRARTNRRGRARIAATFGSAGARTVVARKRGCRGARATIRVR